MQYQHKLERISPEKAGISSEQVKALKYRANQEDNWLVYKGKARVGVV